MSNQQSSAGVSLKDVYNVYADDGTKVAVTGDTDEHTLKSVTIPAGVMGTTGSIRLHAGGYCNGNNGQKKLRVKFDADMLQEFTINAAGWKKSWTLDDIIINMGAVDSQRIDVVLLDDNAILEQSSEGTKALDTSSGFDLKIAGKLNNAADEIAINNWTVEVNPA